MRELIQRDDTDIAGTGDRDNLLIPKSIEELLREEKRRAGLDPGSMPEPDEEERES